MRPRLIDLYCGDGGAAMGYHRAGFDVIGVDIRPRPRYPFTFVQADALTFPIDGFDAAHASPPCQVDTRLAAQHGTTGRHPNLIGPTRDRLAAAGIPYVIENVEPARPRLLNPVMLCGTMFDLDVFRHRLFEIAGFPLLAPPHTRHPGRVGDGRYVTVTGKPGGTSRRDGIRHGRLADWQRAMGIDWMTARGMAQAIPPAFTEFIGAALLGAITHADA